MQYKKLKKNNISNRLKTMHIAIIGAGAAGLCSARHAIDAKFGFTCEIFEQTDDLGGTWVYTDRTGLDEYGIPVHTSMYKGLVTNLPKEIMDFPDFKFPNYEKSYISQEQVLKYLKDYSEHFNVNKYITYRSIVKKVTPNSNNKWNVVVGDVCTETDSEKEFDAVLVCNGHYTKSVTPNIPGSDVFRGKQIHSHEFRNAKLFEKQVVLVVGAGPSGIDIAYRLIEHATKVVLSHRKIAFGATFPTNVLLKPTALHFTETEVHFSDGTSEKIDAIVYCTGYEYSFPFLTEDCGIKVENNFVQPLYKHVVNIERSTMGFIGIPFTVVPFPMFDYQIRLFMKHLKGEIQLPSKEKMMQDTTDEMKLRKDKGYPVKHAHKLGKYFHEIYFADLAKIAQVDPMPPVKIKIYNDGSMKLNRNVIYKIIDDEHFTKTTEL